MSEMTEKEHAEKRVQKEIKEWMSGLNIALEEANDVGLNVVVHVKEEHPVGHKFPRLTIVAEIFKEML